MGLILRSASRLLAELFGDEAAAAPHAPVSKKKQVHVTPLEVAKAYLGRQEDDAEDAQVLSEFIFKAAGMKVNPAATAWCAAFMNAVVASSGYDGTHSMMARSFEDWGDPVDTPEPGDVVVFWRGSRSSGLGHVALFIKDNGDGTITVLGGNQSDSVSIAKYRKSSDSGGVVCYRRPPGQIANTKELQEWEEPDTEQDVSHAN